VCVAGSNDGIIVALTQEAKALGLKRGDAVFKVRDIVERYGVRVFSTNMTLYAAMSKRITSILRSMVQRVESYSIDECFCYLDGYDHVGSLEEYMRTVAQRIALYTDIPVSVGIAPTKTLAKVGSKFAKRYKGYRSVCMIDSEEKRRRALELFDLADVWGIGRQTLKKLNYYGIHTTIDFADKRESWVRSHFNKPVVDTWRELNGIACIDTTEATERQSICTSRSFGQMVTDLDALKESVVTFASGCAIKLRGQGSVTRAVTVFVTTNRFREDLNQYFPSASIRLDVAANSAQEIVGAALRGFHTIYRPGYLYKKAGVIVGDIVPADEIQGSLFGFDDCLRCRQDKLSAVMDAVNAAAVTSGNSLLRLAVQRQGHYADGIRSEFRSSLYSTSLDEIIKVR
jgi:DNA polymerase V